MRGIILETDHDSERRWLQSMENKELRVSFLVPTLGQREFELKRLLDSIHRQTNEHFEVIIVAQDNFEKVEEICALYSKIFRITQINSSEKGISKARNKGMPFCSGDIIILSDDDCWYPQDTVDFVVSAFKAGIDVLLTQIYDQTYGQSYKDYSDDECIISSKIGLHSKSSIEIAFKNSVDNIYFDEHFGLGAKYVCCEEIDFLIQLLKKGAIIKYIPKVTVFHDKKKTSNTNQQIEAKGANYAKNFSPIIGFCVCLRDLILKKENNFRAFYTGYFGYKRIEKGS